MKSLAVNYELPLSANGLRLNLGYSHVSYELDEKYFPDLESTGKSDIFEGTLTYPLIRSGTRNLNLSFNVAHKKMQDDMKDNSGVIDESDKRRTTLGKVNLTHEYWGNIFGKPLYSRLGGGLAFGKFRLPTAEQRARDARDLDGNFQYVNLDFFLNLALSDRWTWSLSGSAQKTLNNNLDSGEQFSVTGAYGVKAYRESISGDNGYLLGTEVRCRLPGNEWLDHYLGAFADYGRWVMENEPYSTLSNQKSDSLADIGLSYYLNLPHFSVKAQLVHALGSRPQESQKEPETYVSIMLVMTL
jgi:hemolysin activation/secretion protein